MGKKSYSQKKREKYPYREMYFKYNPGLFGCIWSCAYCHRPLLGRNNVVVDHIIPLNSPFGRNARFNLVASCQTCNLRKSDSVDYRVAKGYFSKAIESVVFTLQRAVIVAVVACWWIVHAALRGTLQIAQSAFRLMTAKARIAIMIGIVVILLIMLK